MEFFITCNGLPVHISDTKKGNDIIFLLHGYLETLYIWEEFISLLSPYMRVVSIDLPGHGLSGSYPINSMEYCSSTIVSVMDKLNIEKAWLMGHSMGGYVATESIKIFPDRFLGLIMMNSTPFGDSLEKKANRDREISLIKQNKLQSIIK
ncbi:MAG: alpha/beta fold hydrolase, partial [Bacteroidales bacterium]